MNFEKVKMCIDELDCMELLRFPVCAPSDEYDMESKAIFGSLNGDESAEQAAEIIAEIFSKRFAEECKAEGFYSAAKKLTGKSEEHLCPVCRKYSFIEKGSYEICPVCGWEDDPVQHKDHCFYGGANKLSVNESQLKLWLDENGGREKTAEYEKECADDTKTYARKLLDLYCEMTGEDRERVGLYIYGRKMS